MFSPMSADECEQQLTRFKQEEKAYESVIRLKIASQERTMIIGRFIEAAEIILNKCPSSISLDRQYTLKREVKKAEAARLELHVMTLGELRQYAITNPQRRVLYRNGRMTLY